MAILTVHTSLLYQYSACPQMSRSTACTLCVYARFMWTCPFRPTTCISLTAFWGSVSCHGSINAFHLFWTSGSQGQIYTLPSFFVQPCYIYALPFHTPSRTVFSPRTRAHDCLSLSFQKDNFTPHTTFLLGSSQHTELEPTYFISEKYWYRSKGLNYN
jgi:hypothetical protein